MICNYAKGSKTRLSANFNSSEFDCHGKDCCHNTKIDTKLIEYLQNIRNYFGKPVIINSGYRCETHNDAVGGATRSKHRDGMAADIVVKGINPAQVAAFAEHLGVKGIGLYDDFVHIDTRTEKAFWYSHKQEYRSTFGGSNAYVYDGTLLRMGSKGESVKWLQRELSFLGYPCGNIDGIFGAKTRAALIKFQRAEKIADDGICGPITVSKIRSKS